MATHLSRDEQCKCRICTKANTMPESRRTFEGLQGWLVRLLSLLFVAMLGLRLVAAVPVKAAERHCVSGEASQALCIEESFATFWKSYGGADVFGKPSEPAEAPAQPLSEPEQQSFHPAPPVAPIRHESVPAVPCNGDVPIPTSGLQLWSFTEGDQMVVCARLLLEGQSVQGANITVYRHHANGRTLPTLSHTTGYYYGVVDFIFYVGPGSLGRPDSLEAVASYRGATYRALVRP